MFMKKIILYVILSFTVALTGVRSSHAQILIGPQSVGLAQTYATQSRGASIFGWNPANLGYADNPRFSLQFGIFPFVPFPSLQLINSSVSLGWFNRYFTHGGTLTDQDKNAILSVFPHNGWDLSPQINAQIIGLSFGKSALTFQLNAQGSVVLPTSLLSFAFYGNEFDKPLSLNDLNTEAQVVGALSFAHGEQVSIPFLRDIAEETYIGGGVKALIGLGYGGTESATGSITSYTDHILAEGSAKARYAIGGYGLAFDAGISTKFNDRIQAGLAFNNLFGFIQWTNRYSMAYNYSIHLDTDTLDIFSNEMDSVLDKAVKVDTSYEGVTFRTPYPAYLIAGVQYTLTQRIRLFLNYKQGLSNRFNMTFKPRFSLAAELSPSGWFLFRTGIAVGGKERLQLAAGLGFHGRHYAFDFGAASTGGLFNHSRGVSIALGQEVRW